MSFLPIPRSHLIKIWLQKDILIVFLVMMLSNSNITPWV
jgi:hypothetical protein